MEYMVPLDSSVEIFPVAVVEPTEVTDAEESVGAVVSAPPPAAEGSSPSGSRPRGFRPSMTYTARRATAGTLIFTVKFNAGQAAGIAVVASPVA